MPPPPLLAVPNVSEGRNSETIAAIGEAIVGADGMSEGGVRLLDVHSDADHHRSVFTLAGRPGELADGLLRGAKLAVQRIDVINAASADSAPSGQHPYVGALDVAPVVYLDPGARGAACAEALVVADRIAEELWVPVFLYGELTASDQRPERTRAELRRGGAVGLAERLSGAGRWDIGERPDFGPPRMHPTAGATLVAAREPLVAFNLQLVPPATLKEAQGIAALIREGGAQGLPGVRAIGVQLSGGVAQVSMNIERPLEITLAAAIAAVRRLARVDSAELVGLAPRAVFQDFPEDVPLPGFDPARHLIENALGF